MSLGYPIIFAIILSVCHFSQQSSSPYSLQSAVEALNEREAELRDELANENVDDFLLNRDDYDIERGQLTPDRVLARYYARTSPYNDDYLDYRKRAIRKRAGASVFRERSRLPSQHQQQQAHLAEKFLKAIEKERERERSEEYREELKDLWSRYQKEENGIEKELFNDNDNDIESEYGENYEAEDKKKKRQRGEVEVAPTYWNEKRSMPLLPWLPASRKKRFPVAKRSPSVSETELVKETAAEIVKNNDKITQDLKGIFGAINDGDDKMKKKRSLDEMNHESNSEKETKPVADHQHEHSSMMAHHSHDNGEKKKILKKRSSDDEDEETEHGEHDNDEEGDDATEDGDESEDSSEEDAKKKKKKREAAKKSVAVAQSTAQNNGPMEKRSVQWSNILGIDRKKKSSLKKYDDDDEDSSEDEDEEDEDARRKKRNAAKKKSLEVVGAESFPDRKSSVSKKSIEWSNLFGIDRKKKSFRKRFSNFNEEEEEDYEEPDENPISIGDSIVYSDDDYEDDERRKRQQAAGLIFHPLKEMKAKRLYNNLLKNKRSKEEERLETMDRKLKAMENLIVEDTAQYFSLHGENLNPSEIKNTRGELAERLETIYGLEKMRRAIARLRQSMAFQKSLERNLLDAPLGVNREEEEDDYDDKKKAKRVAIKKEKVEFDNNDHEIDAPPPMKKLNDEAKNDLTDDDDKKKKKKRSEKKSITTNEVSDDRVAALVSAPMSEGYMGGNGVFQDDCPLLSAIEKRCRGIDLLTGDTHHNLLEACGAHQLCYLCGDSETQCDYGYLYEIQDTCGHSSKCKLNGNQALRALRNFAGMKIGPRECVRNPCLNSALRSLGY